MQQKIPDDIMLNIAAENGVAETAFVLKCDTGYQLRWFTPDIEMDLCGHATLASAYVLYNFFNEEAVSFQTHEGKIDVYKEIAVDNKELYVLNFPVRECKPAVLPSQISESLNIQPKNVFLARDYILEYNSEEDIRNISIKRGIFDKINIDPGGVAVTAIGSECDFVSRFFTPQATILEDPVTGSSHCTLAPFWSEKLKKKVLHARQLSKRGGDLYCEINNGRALIKGEAVCYSIGKIEF